MRKLLPGWDLRARGCNGDLRDESGSRHQTRNPSGPLRRERRVQIACESGFPAFQRERFRLRVAILPADRERGRSFIAETGRKFARPEIELDAALIPTVWRRYKLRLPN